MREMRESSPKFHVKQYIYFKLFEPRVIKKKKGRLMLGWTCTVNMMNERRLDPCVMELSQFKHLKSGIERESQCGTGFVCNWLGSCFSLSQCNCCTIKVWELVVHVSTKQWPKNQQFRVEWLRDKKKLHEMDSLWCFDLIIYYNM